MWPPTKAPSRFKERLEIAQSIVTIAAVFIGGIWTYNLFIKERHEFPHANIEQKLFHVALSDETNLLRVGIELSNTGNSLMKIGSAIIRVQQISPSLPCTASSACAGNEISAAIKEI